MKSRTIISLLKGNTAGSCVVCIIVLYSVLLLITEMVKEEAVPFSFLFWTAGNYNNKLKLLDFLLLS